MEARRSGTFRLNELTEGRVRAYPLTPNKARSLLGHQERWLLWRPLDVPPAEEERCHLSPGTIERWLDGAGKRARETVREWAGDEAACVVLPELNRPGGGRGLRAVRPGTPERRPSLVWCPLQA